MRKNRSQIYDELLVIKCRQGDKSAFDELVGRWQKRLWSYAYRVTGSESVAWDVVQEAWYSIIKGIRKLDDVSVFTQDIGNLYKKQLRKAVIECYVRLAAAGAVTVYGAIGIKYNTGWYVTWALFTAIVGVNAAMAVLLWGWQIQTKLSIQRGLKELQLQIAELAGKKSSSED